jgi:leader peptidase (prepilin peptidase)/N-methyltransferase
LPWKLYPGETKDGAFVTFQRHVDPPTDVMLVGIAASTGVLTAASLVSHQWWPLGRAVVGLVAMLAFYLAIRLIDPIAVGYGDVLFAAAVGAFLGYISWAALAVGVFLGYLLGDAGTVVIIHVRKLPSRAGIPFSPFIAAGGVLAAVVADPVTDFVLRLVHSG